MAWLARLPLYATFLLIVLGASIVVGVATYHLQLDKVVSQVEQSQIARISQRLVQLQGTIDDFNRRGNINAIHREIARLSVDPSLRTLLVVDQHGVVRFSSVIDYRNRMASEIADPDLPATMARISDPFGGVDYDPDNHRVTARYPVEDIKGSRPFGGGHAQLLGVFDIGIPVAQAVFDHEQNVIQGMVFDIGVLMAAFLLLYGSIRSRMNRIIDTTRAFARGDYHSRIGLDGRDEFAAIGNTLDQMAGEIEMQHHSLQQLAHYDALTELPNRNHLLGRLEQLLAEGGGGCFTLLFIDLDRFKVVNDTLGHHVGDKMLQVIAQRLASCIKGSDTIARFGGDEFLVLLEGVAVPDALEGILQRLLQHIGEPMLLEGQPMTVSASIGVARYPADAATAQTLIRRADIAMYQAKMRGKNTYHFFEAETDELSPDQLSLEHHLRQQIEQGEVLAHFQPQYDAHARQVVGFEALARMRGPDGELLGPKLVIPLLEEMGLMVPFGIAMARRAIADYRQWLRSARPATVPTLALNISCSQLDAGGFLAQLDALLEETGMDPRLLEFEITEETLLRNIEQKTDLLHEIRARGVRIAIDDFGTGYSSLSYLKKLPIDQLKIDASFVRDINLDADDNAIIETIIAMATKLELGVIAEGVETAEQLHFLLRHRCHCIQGYHFARPAPLAELDLKAAVEGVGAGACRPSDG